MTIGDLPLAAQIGVAIVTAFAWFAATCFFSGVVIGAIQVVSYMRAERFPDLPQVSRLPGGSKRRA